MLLVLDCVVWATNALKDLLECTSLVAPSECSLSLEVLPVPLALLESIASRLKLVFWPLLQHLLFWLRLTVLSDSSARLEST